MHMCVCLLIYELILVLFIMCIYNLMIFVPESFAQQTLGFITNETTGI